ncbi:MAG: YybH family protein [bacterium]
MKKFLTIHAVILAALVLIWVSCEDPPEPIDPEADFNAINDFWEQYAATINAGDLDGWMSLWTDDGIQMAPDAPPVIGKERIRAKYEIILSQYTLQLEVINEEGRVQGDLAYSRTSYQTQVAPKSGGRTFRITGKALSILERQADGSWKISHDCFNDNAPMQAQ